MSVAWRAAGLMPAVRPARPASSRPLAGSCNHVHTRIPTMRLTCLLAFAVLAAGCGQSGSRVTLYCALDREFAEEVFGEFTKQSNLTVTPHFDTEANKSVSLALELERDARRPRCDVHWNNEILWTIYLQKKGLLEPYASPSAKPYPD